MSGEPKINVVLVDDPGARRDRIAEMMLTAAPNAIALHVPASADAARTMLRALSTPKVLLVSLGAATATSGKAFRSLGMATRSEPDLLDVALVVARPQEAMPWDHVLIYEAPDARLSLGEALSDPAFLMRTIELGVRRHALRQRRALEEIHLVLGELRLIPSRREAVAGAVRIKLTQGEQRLLLLLAASQDHVVSTAHAIEAYQIGGAASPKGALASRLSRLRGKLGNLRHRLRSVPGVGVCWEQED